MNTMHGGVAGRVMLVVIGMWSLRLAAAPAGAFARAPIGVNLAGAEFAGQKVPGVEGREYGWPTPECLDYWHAKGMRLVRLPFLWERLQPELMGSFETNYMAALKRTIDELRARHMQVVLDVHNYAKYRGQKIGSEQVPVAAFADLWGRLATTFKDDPVIWGYGLMNEPACKPWAPAAQAAVLAIRKADMHTPIVVANDYPGWSASPSSILKYGGAAGKSGDLATWAAERMPIGDPATFIDPGSNIIFEIHVYLDHDNSGTYRKSYAEEIARTDGPGVRVSPEIGVDRIRPFAAWVKRHGVRGYVGEFGVPANPNVDLRWLEALDRTVAFIHTNNIACTYWAAGPRWTPGNPNVIERSGWPTGTSKEERLGDRPQLKVLMKYMQQP